MEARRTFVPVVVPGVLGSVVAAVGAAHAWARPVSNSPADLPTSMITSADSGIGTYPLALALSLAGLAAWGALLVTRGRTRSAFAAIGSALTLGALATSTYAAFHATAGVRSAIRDQVGMSRKAVNLLVDVHLTGWFWMSLVGAVVALVAFTLAVRRAPAWPGMSRRYDAPGSQSAPRRPSTNQEIWKSIDEGHDPTT